jgi:hypothetical protein
MKFIKLLLFTMIVLQSPIAKAEEAVPPTVPEWLACKLDEPASYSFTTEKTLFVSLPNKQVWGIYKNLLDGTMEANGLLGPGLTIHEVTYSTKNRIESSFLATHSLNGRYGDSFIRYIIDMKFNSLEVANVIIQNDMLWQTPKITCYTCQPVYVKPKLIEIYEKKYLKKGYLEYYLKK